jgi:iron complex outermembrane receptor protein
MISSLSICRQHNYGPDTKGLGFAIGVDGRNVDAKKDSNTINYVAATGAAANLGSIGSVPNYQSFGFPYPIVFLDYEKFADTVRPGLAVNASTTRNDSLSADYRYLEDILAAYASGMYNFGNTHVIGGLRFETVKYHAYSPQSAAGIYTGTFAENDGSYNHVLPSIGVTQDVWDNVKLKAAFSESLGRPAFSDVAQAEVRNDQTLTISRGNPDLKPREAKNYDVAAEYYFNGGDGMISLSGFYKDIKNEIFALHTTQDINGVAYDVNQPMNASTSSVKGIELAVIDNSIGFLPGFLRDKIGVTANVTRMWGSMDYLVSGAVKHRDALLYQPNWLLNTAVFYKLPGGGEARVAWNWIDETLNTTSNGSFADYVTQPRGQLNASIRLPLTDSLLLKLEGSNLLEDNKSMMHGYYSNRYTLTMDRVFFLDLIYKH